MRKILVFMAFCFLGSNLFAQTKEDYVKLVPKKVHYWKTEAPKVSDEEIIKTLEAYLVKPYRDIDKRALGMQELLERPDFLYDIYGNCVPSVGSLLKSSEDDAKKYFDAWELRVKTPLFLAEYIKRHHPNTQSAKSVKETLPVVYQDLDDAVSSAKEFLVDDFPSGSDQEILKNDARLFLLAYTREGAGASDEEIAVRSFSKICEGLSTRVGGGKYAAAVLSIVKEGNIDFLSEVKLGKYASFAQDYLKVVNLFKDFRSIFKREGQTVQIDELTLERATKIKEMKVELGKFKALK
jgi:hypothetical protein